MRRSSGSRGFRICASSTSGDARLLPPGASAWQRCCPRPRSSRNESRRRPMFKRRPVAVGMFTLLVFAMIAAPLHAEVRKQTLTYKKVGPLEIKADVFREDDDRARPVVVWIHGGALIMGNREAVSKRVK